ncbi:MAG: GNAT family N-acetyltransferase [Candidatus Hermodarchaeota archaeon]
MKDPVRLETKRLELCRYKEEDFNNFCNIISNEYCINYLSIRAQDNIHKEAESIFSLILSSYNTPNPQFVLKILKKGNNDFIGTCGLRICRESTTAECFYALLPLYQGSGFAIEAMLKVLEYSFNILGIPKILIYLHPSNSKSWRVAERIGMKYMGHVYHKSFIPKAMLFVIKKVEYHVQHLY